MIEKVDPTRKTTRVIVAVAMVAILFPVGYSAVKHFTARGRAGAAPFLERPPAVYEECVRATDYMRYRHWELLRDVREAVVREGRRGDLTLARCAECHTSRAAFCDRCHRAASVTPDCFDCHHYPGDASAAAASAEMTPVAAGARAAPAAAARGGG